MAGRSREQLLGRLLEDQVAPEDRATAVAAFGECIAAGQWLGEWAIVAPGGARTKLEIAAAVTQLDGQPRVLVICLTSVAAEAGRFTRREPEPLTPREREIVNFVAAGLTTREISDVLVVSPETVRTHVRNAMTKLRAHTRAHLVALVLTREHVLADIS